jgi:alpha-1,3-mannosyltransferase
MPPTVDNPSLRARFDACVKYVHALLFDHAHFPVLAALVILGDAVLTQLIIHFVPCTSTLYRALIRDLKIFRHRD